MLSRKIISEQDLTWLNIWYILIGFLRHRTMNLTSMYHTVEYRLIVVWWWVSITFAFLDPVNELCRMY